MNRKTEAALKALAELDEPWCNENCPVGGDRCCVRRSCDFVKDDVPDELKTMHNPRRETPFMRPGGCSIPPEYRAYCTTFVCDDFRKHGPYKAHMAIIERMAAEDRLRWRRSVRRIQGIFAGFPK